MERDVTHPAEIVTNDAELPCRWRAGRASRPPLYKYEKICHYLIFLIMFLGRLTLVRSSEVGTFNIILSSVAALRGGAPGAGSRQSIFSASHITFARVTYDCILLALRQLCVLRFIGSCSRVSKPDAPPPTRGARDARGSRGPFNDLDVLSNKRTMKPDYEHYNRYATPLIFMWYP